MSNMSMFWGSNVPTPRCEQEHMNRSKEQQNHYLTPLSQEPSLQCVLLPESLNTVPLLQVFLSHMRTPSSQLSPHAFH